MNRPKCIYLNDVPTDNMIAECLRTDCNRLGDTKKSLYDVSSHHRHTGYPRQVNSSKFQASSTNHPFRRGTALVGRPNVSPANQEIPIISRNPKLHSRVQKSLPPLPIPNHTNPVYEVPSHIFNIHFNIIPILRLGLQVPSFLRRLRWSSC
jgi:hypothetical protein